MYDIESKLSDTEVDDLVFVSDVDYSHKSIETQHQSLVTNGKYSEAANFLNNAEGITPYTANLFNLMANRTKALQEKVITKTVTKVMNIENEEPENPNEKINWISDLE